MFSLDRFYNILHNNLISCFTNGRSIYHYPFGTYQHQSILQNDTDSVVEYFSKMNISKIWFHCYFFDQEPIYDYTLPIIENNYIVNDGYYGPRRINVLANSEHSQIKNDFIRTQGYYNWYYFFHGFAALDWYRDFQYLQPSTFDRFDKVFICFNHLISKYRSYRLHLVSNLAKNNLLDHGHVSFFPKDDAGTWQEAVKDLGTWMQPKVCDQIAETLGQLPKPLVIDTNTPVGSLSASVNVDWLTSALFHVVTETVYFLPKLHLTEKVFKPIVAKRPFFLVAAPGNLAYLKSYGFRTFDRWIDESYDEETDHYIRIEKITAELKRLCELSPSQLKQMHTEMQQTLEYNFDHFYGNFKNVIVDELVDNFEHVLCQINNGRQPGNHSRYHHRFELSPEYLEQVKKRLKQ